MPTHNDTYAAARKNFLALTGGAEMEVRKHPLAGPEGEIAMDIACWGDRNAPRALVVSSGTHGVEGYCGSFIQCELLAQGIVDKLPADMMLMMIHGINPYGFAWKRRGNEDNIDLNRNFFDHDNPPPRNEGYAEIANIFEPEEWHEGAIDAIFDALAQVRAKHDNSHRWQQAAMSGGQYEFPNGIFYGGVAPAWSNLQLNEVVTQNLKDKTVTWIDVHTGLGHLGAAECIVEYEKKSRPFQRAVKLWGDRVKTMRTNESISAYVSGSIETGLDRWLGDKLVGCGLEFGTRRSKQVVEALIADQWLHRYGDLNSEQGKAIKALILDAFFPDDPEWRQLVIKGASEVVQAAIDE